MRWVLRLSGLLLVATYPLGLCAQVVPYSGPASPGGAAAPTAYQQPVSASDTTLTLSPQKPRSLTGHTEPDKRPAGLQPLMTVGGSLAVVLGVFFLLVWVLRKASPNGFATLPPEAFEVLGRAALAHRQQVHLLRCGNKLLLVSVTATGAETLAEITDPAEVDRLASLCRQGRSRGAAAAFRQVFRPGEDRDA